MRYFSLIFLFLASSACLDEPDCLVTATNQIKIVFVDASTHTAITTGLNFVQIKATGTSDVFYASQTNVKSVTLPLNPNTSETTFTFVRTDVTDTVTIAYDKSHLVVSSKCGAYTYFKNASVSESTAEYVKVKNPSLFTTVTDNIEIAL